MATKAKVFHGKDKSAASTHYDIRTLLRRKPTAGEIGIEIEVEGNKFKKESVPSPWAYHKDNSLRGHDNAEYVLINPIKFTEVKGALDSLWGMFSEYGSVLDESNRTSVHVHLNMQSFHLNRLCSFLALFYAIEELLTEWCGDHRVGNLFCLRAKDAPAVISKIKAFIANDGVSNLNDGLHYSNANAAALVKFGSMEIRSLRGVNDPQTILDWVEVLERLYTLSDDFKDPRTICDEFSGNGPFEFLKMVLGPKYSTVVDAIDFDQQKIMQSLYDGIRLAQDLCYCRDWSLYKPVTVAKDPFGRNGKKKIAIDEVTQVIAAGGFNTTQVMTIDQYAQSLAQTPPSPGVPAGAWDPEIPEAEDEDDYEEEVSS